MMQCGTAIFAMRGDGSFLLCRRAKPGPGYNTWSVPGGAIEEGETWQEAAQRELLEETSLVVADPHLLAVTSADGWLTIWSAGPCTAKPQAVVLDSESAECEWVTCGDLWRYDLWKGHWTPLLDEVGGTVMLDRRLRGRST